MKMTFVQALNSALDLALAGDARVFLMGEDIGHMGGDFGVTKGLWAKYGEERVRDTPLSEAGFVGAAVGAAMVGMRPVAEIMFADFMGECYDQMVNNAAKMTTCSTASSGRQSWCAPRRAAGSAAGRTIRNRWRAGS